MKKKIPFSLEYKDKIESGEVEVVTRDDHPVRIICWDADTDWSICALIKDHNPKSTYGFPQLFDNEGKCIREKSKDLFLLVEEELTEFQALLQAFANMLFENYTDEDHIIISSTLESWEKKFLEYAEDALEKKFRTQSFQQGYEQALGDSQEAMLKSMPMWKKQSYDPYSTWLSMRPNDYILFHKGYYISLSELEKLPKEE